ncbi:MAG: GyrI-like domain-containing protein [Bdellovibrionales bacterium]|nr:GyrI-like domain-containing protein [Bdellovibrionales bacterium]
MFKNESGRSYFAVALWVLGWLLFSIGSLAPVFAQQMLAAEETNIDDFSPRAFQTMQLLNDVEVLDTIDKKDLVALTKSWDQTCVNSNNKVISGCKLTACAWDLTKNIYKNDCDQYYLIFRGEPDLYKTSGVSKLVRMQDQSKSGMIRPGDVSDISVICTETPCNEEQFRVDFMSMIQTIPDELLSSSMFLSSQEEITLARRSPVYKGDKLEIGGIKMPNLMFKKDSTGKEYQFVEQGVYLKYQKIEEIHILNLLAHLQFTDHQDMMFLYEYPAKKLEAVVALDTLVSLTKSPWVGLYYSRRNTTKPGRFIVLAVPVDEFLDLQEEIPSLTIPDQVVFESSKYSNYYDYEQEVNSFLYISPEHIFGSFTLSIDLNSLPGWDRYLKRSKQI